MYMEMKRKRLQTNTMPPERGSYKEIIDDYYSWQQEEAELDGQITIHTQPARLGFLSGEESGELKLLEDLYHRLLDAVEKK
jgi:hypothetical protein